MGSCVSSYLRKSPTQGYSVADIPSRVKDTALNGGGGGSGGVVKSQWPVTQSTPAVRDYGSEDDVFFDSKAWLDSDCEDDFFSVNGDFTPSRGNTPLHPTFTGGKTPSITIDNSPPSIPEPSPNTIKKKRLAELFRDSIGGNEEAPNLDNDKTVPEEPPKPPATTILDVLPSSEPEEEKLDRPVQHRCLPSLMSCRISVDRKKKMAPATAIPVLE